LGISMGKAISCHVFVTIYKDYDEMLLYGGLEAVVVPLSRSFMPSRQKSPA
jgi:hypothetical protein